MPTRRWVGAWLLCASAVLPLPAAGQDRTEQEILALVVRESPQAVAIRSAVDVVRREQDARTVFPNPSVAYAREGAGFTEFLQAEQFLPVFGTRAALARAGVAATEAAEAERDARLWLLRAEARNAIARLVSEQNRLAAAESTVTAVQRLIDVLRIREKEGEGSRFDRLRAEQELADAKQNVLVAAVGVAEARGQLAAYLPAGVRLGGVVGTADGLLIAPLPADLASRAAASRAELRALQRSARRFDLEADAARRAQRPTPTAMGGFKRADNGDRRDAGGVFGLSVTVPLFNTGSREAARWHAERVRVEGERASLENAIRADVTRAAETLTLQQRAFTDPSLGAATGDELVTIADVAYQEGDVGILELLDAYRTAARARIRTIELRLSVRLAQIALERAVGETLWP